MTDRFKDFNLSCGAACLAALLLSLTGCASLSHATPGPSAAPEVVLSAEQLHTDKLKHLPTDNESGRREPLGDILQELAYLDPKNPELEWYQRLPSLMQQEVTLELNRYTFVLEDKLLVKARLRDDYDMRWRFADPAPTRAAIEGPSPSTGESPTVQVVVEDLHNVVLPRTSNDQRSFNAHFGWRPDHHAKWSDEARLSQEAVRFTLPLHYSADCEIINRVPRLVQSLGGIKSIELLPDGSVRMTTYEKSVPEMLTSRLVLNGKGEANSVIAKTGDHISIILINAIGYGASGYTYMGTHNGKFRFEGFSWFYEIEPAYRDILEVLPYEKEPTTKP